MTTGNKSHRSKTNLDEYINFFDSSVILANTHSDLKQPQTNDNSGISSSHHLIDEEHTTTKKRQTNRNTAIVHPANMAAASGAADQ